MKSRLGFVLLLCLVAAVICTAVACTSNSAPLAPMSEVSLNDHFLAWEEMEDAIFYSVRVTRGKYGYEVPVEQSPYSLALFDEGTYSLQVRAYTLDGFTDYSPALTYTLAQDVNVTPTENEAVSLRGSGTYEDPILIYTKEELALVPAEPRSVVTNGVSEQYVNYFRLMADIDLSGMEWKSIGTSAKPFTGYFDGNGHIISNLKQTKYNEDTYRYGGLFGNTNGAIITNLKVQNVDIKLGVSVKSFNVGGLIGESKQTIVDNCSVSGSIAIDSPQSSTQQAAVGMMAGTSWGTIFRHCSTSGNIDVTFARVYAGGFMGISRNTQHEYLTDCISRVDVHTTGTGVESTTNAAPHGTSFACGFGYISNTSGIKNCVWLGTAKADSITGTATNLYGAGMFANTGKVTSTSGICNIAFVDCYFDAYAMDFVDHEVYDDLASVADRYLVAGAQAQQRGTYAYCVDETNRDKQEGYPTLDFESTWEIQNGALALQERITPWHDVTYMVGDEVYLVDHILEGYDANAPDGKDIAGFVKWDVSPTAVQEDITVHAQLRSQSEEQESTPQE